MATTSLKLPETLKQRVIKQAEIAGKTPHAVMLEMIANETERAEKQQAFLARAEASLRHYQATGISYDADEVMTYYRAKIQGIAHPMPQAIKTR